VYPDLLPWHKTEVLSPVTELGDSHEWPMILYAHPMTGIYETAARESI